MPRLLVLAPLAITMLAGCGAGSAAPASSGTPSASASASSSASASAPLVEIGAGLQGPAGLTATVAATGLANVAALAVDGEGRLWASTAGYSAEGDDGVYVVASNRATPTKAIGGLSTPLGLLWIGDMLYVSSASGVDAYRGFDGSAFASHASVVALPSDVGEPNALALSPTGRIVLGISAPCDACTPTNPESAAIVSFLPDGTGLRVEASGIRAPVGLAYDPATGDLLVTMNQRDDLGAQTPGDWLAIVRSGQNWGFPDCYGQGGAACAGVPAPIALLDAHAGVSGVAIVSGALGTTAGSSAIVAEWSTGRVLQVALKDDGSTEGGTVAPYLVGLKNPVPVILAPDGALLVGDWGTGTVFRIAPA
jgi:glucose/arabinose dehydrogenase